MKLIIFFLFFIQNQNLIFSFVKNYFSSNQWLMNPKIWSAERLPCMKDKIILPEKVVLFFNEILFSKKLILPKNGILIFDQFKTKSKNDCKEGKENKLLIKRNSWFDTSNWNTQFHNFVFFGEDQITNPIPHYNRIPCKQDEVIFNSKTNFKLIVDLDKQKYEINNLSINNKKLNSREFERYVKSKIGNLQFYIDGDFPFYISNKENNENLNICQDNFNIFYNKICQNVIHQCPEKNNCLKTIRPIGFCCDICGTLIKIQFNDNKVLSKDHIENNIISIHTNKYKTVNFYLNKISETNLEIISIDTNSNQKASKKFSNEIINFLNKGNFFNIKSIVLETSEKEETNYLKEIFLFLIIIILILLILFHLKNKNLVLNLRENLSKPINYFTKTENETESLFTFVRFNSDQEDNLSFDTNIKNKRELIELKKKKNKIHLEEDTKNINFQNPFFEKKTLN